MTFNELGGMHRLVMFLVFAILTLFTIMFFVLSKICDNSLSEKKRLCTEETLATVVKVQSREIGSSVGNPVSTSYSWYFTYSYEVDGNIIETESKIGSSSKCFEKGEKVKLFFNPNNSKQIYVPDDKTSSLGNILKTIGIILAFVEVVSLVIILVVSKLS